MTISMTRVRRRILVNTDKFPLTRKYTRNSCRAERAAQTPR